MREVVYLPVTLPLRQKQLTLLVLVQSMCTDPSRDPRDVHRAVLGAGSGEHERDGAVPREFKF